DPRDEGNFFASLAVDSHTFFQVFDEMKVDPAAMETWQHDRQGAILGDVLAQKLGAHVGQTITLPGTIYPGDWQFHVDGIYEATRKSVDRSQLIFHWDYLNESIPEVRRDQIGWMIARID